MITFDKTQNVIRLDNGSICYLIYINSQGYLETVYFGKSVADFNIDSVRKAPESHEDTRYFSRELGKEVAYSDGYKEGVAPLELSPHGLRDKRYSPIVIQRDNGSYATDFLYVSHRIYDGVAPLNGLPSVHGDNCATVEFLLKERSRELYVKHRITIFADKDVIVKNFEITNNTGKDVVLSRAMSMQIDLPKNCYTLNYFCGRWAEERRHCETPIGEGAKEVYSNNGASSAEANPFVYLKSTNADYDYGEALGFNILYSGNFKFRVSSDYWQGLHVTYGINDEDFAWVLKEGDSFVTPQTVIAYSNRGIDGMSQTFHNFVRDNIISYKYDNKYKPVLFNSWEGCYFNFNTDSIISYIDDAKEIGAELFVLDDGWFGRRSDDTDGLGDWYVNKDKIDLHKVIKHCKSKGLKFGIWFEPEMVNFNSDLYKVHPEYALSEQGEDIRPARHQLCLDFSNPEVVDNVYRQMKAFLNEYDVDYIKWDYNRRVYEHTSSFFGAERQGEIYHRLTLGYYSLLSRIASEHPNIMIEGCAGGGARFDLGTLCYCPQIWTSDESNPVRRSVINFNTSLGYPLRCMATHVNDCSLMDYRQKSLFALFGAYGYEMNPNKLTDDDKAVLSKTAELYKKYHKDVIEDGTLYHLRSPQTDNWYVMQCVSKDKSTSMVLLMNILHEKDQFRFIKLKGLDACKKYRNSLDNKVYYGDFYMNVGLNCSQWWANEFNCELVILEEAVFN